MAIDVDGRLTFTDFSVTEIGCEPAVMDVEAAMLAVLAVVDRFDLDGDRLTFSNGDGTAQLVMTTSSPMASNGSTPDPTAS
jgi:heat shock protein HslJ